MKKVERTIRTCVLLSIALLSSFTPCPAQDSLRIEPVASWWRGISIAMDAVMIDSMALIASSQAGIHIVDLHHPVYPAVLNTIQCREPVNSIVKISDHRLFAATNNHTIFELQYTPPTTITKIDSFTLPTLFIGDLEYENNLLAVRNISGSTSHQLALVDVTVADRPEILFTDFILENLYDFRMQNRIGYATSKDPARLYSFSLLTPDHPVLLDSLVLTGANPRIEMVGNRMYIPGQRRIHCIDISNPSRLNELTAFEVTFPIVDDVAVQDSLLFIAGGNAGLHVFQLFDDRRLEEVGHLAIRINQTRNLIQAGNDLLVLRGSEPSLMIDITDPASLALTQDLSQMIPGTWLTRNSGFGFVWSSNQIAVFDLDKLPDIEIVYTLDIEQQISGLLADDTHLVVVYTQNSYSSVTYRIYSIIENELQQFYSEIRFDCQDPYRWSPEIAGRLHGSFLYFTGINVFADDQLELAVYSLESPDTLVMISSQFESVELPDRGHLYMSGSQIVGNYLYATYSYEDESGFWYRHFHSYDISDPYDVRLVSDQIEGLDDRPELWHLPDANLLMSLDGWRKRYYSLENPANPVFISQEPRIHSESLQAVVDGRYIFTKSDNIRERYLTISAFDPSTCSFRDLGRFSPGVPHFLYGALPHDEYLLSNDQYNLVVLRISEFEPTAAPENALPRKYSVSNAWPNPFNPSTRIQVGLTTSSHLSVTVYDLLGRTVTTLADQEFEAGNHMISWDGKNEQGRDVVTGMYFIRVTSDQGTQIRKVVLLR